MPTRQITSEEKIKGTVAYLRLLASYIEDGLIDGLLVDVEANEYDKKFVIVIRGKEYDKLPERPRE